LIPEPEDKAYLNSLLKRIEDSRNYYACFPCTYQDSIIAAYLLNKMLSAEILTLDEFMELKERVKKAQRAMVQAQLDWITLHAGKDEMFKKLETRNAVSSVFCCIFDDKLVLTRPTGEIPYE
jgi:hypothetical protein